MDFYRKAVAIAKSNGLTSKDVDLALLEVAGKYSNMTDNEIRTILQSEINSKCEPIYESQGADAFNQCTQRLVDEYRLNQLRNSTNVTFWNNVGEELVLSQNQKIRYKNINYAVSSVSLLGSVGGLIYANKTGGGFWRYIGWWIAGGLILGVPAALISLPFKNKIIREAEKNKK